MAYDTSEFCAHWPRCPFIKCCDEHPGGPCTKQERDA